MAWVASRRQNPNLLKQFTEANDPVKQMLAGLNKSFKADNRAIINRVVKAEQSISKRQDSKDNLAVIPHRLSKELQSDTKVSCLESQNCESSDPGLKKNKKKNLGMLDKSGFNEL